MADSEVRQKFEVWVIKERGDEVRELEPMGWTVWQAAYSAGRLEGLEEAPKIADEWIRKSFAKAREAGMRAGESARWIPIEERMPESDGEYWVWLVPHKPQPSSMDDGDMVFSAFTPHAEKVRTWINKEGKRRFNCGATSFPTHWQPLPAAPEEKKP